MDPIINRAMNAWRRASSLEPSSTLSTIEEFDGRRYVVLRDNDGILAVYRVRNSGMLKRLRRFPAEIGE